MKRVFIIFIAMFLLTSLAIPQQIIDSLWSCEYATWDDPENGTGINTSATAVFSNNTFVALITVPTTTNYLVGYRNATAGTGRLGFVPYNTSGILQKWYSGLDEVAMQDAFDIATSNDTLIYVANNDVPDRNILVFFLGKDSVYSTDFRMATTGGPNFAIDSDVLGNVYLTKEGSETTAGEVQVYKSILTDINWLTTHTSAPIQTITLPEVGFVRGIAVQKWGNIIYVSNHSNGKVYCYTGNPTAGYTLYNGFNLAINDSIPGQTVVGRPLGMKLMRDKNLLLIATHVFRGGSKAYPYGRIYFANPNTGAILGYFSIAGWNYKMTGAYNTRGDNGKQPNVSGYTSVYSVDADENYNIYTNSYYGWTVDKYVYSQTLPTIPILITDVEQSKEIATSFSLNQNYPNPFNPSTTITFSLQNESNVSLTVYNQLGEKVTDLIAERNMNAGEYKMTFDASKLASGIYFYTLKAGNFVETKKMTLIK